MSEPSENPTPVRSNRSLALAALAGALLMAAIIATTVLVLTLVNPDEPTAPSSPAQQQQQAAQPKISGPLAMSDFAKLVEPSKTPMVWLGQPKDGSELRVNETSTKVSGGILDIAYLDAEAKKRFNAENPTFTVRVSSGPIPANVKLSQLRKQLPEDSRKVRSNANKAIVAYLPPKNIESAGFPFIVEGDTVVTGQVQFAAPQNAESLTSAARQLNFVTR